MADGLHLEGKNRASGNDSSSGSNLSSVDASDTKSSQLQSPADTVQRPLSDLQKAEGRGQPGFRQVYAKPRQTSGDPAAESSLYPRSKPESLQQLYLSSYKSSAKVRFEAQPITAIWPAHSSQEYDRRSIVVDLSKTPFALFRKDAVMMKAAAAASASSTPLPRPSPSALDVAHQTSVPEVPSRSPSSRSAREMSTESLRSDDSYASDSSTGHTDNETDLDPSDSDSSPCSKRIPGLRKGLPEGKPAFFGVWKRTSSEGYENFLLSSGVPKKATAMALRRHTVHIIDHDGTYVRLIVKNGLSKVDNTFFIGDEPRVDMIGKQVYHVSLNWGNLAGYGSKDDLTLSSICHERGEEVIAVRSLIEDGTRMVLTQILRRPAEQYEVRAKHFFRRIMHKSELQARGRVPSSNIVTIRLRSTSQTSSTT